MNRLLLILRGVFSGAKGVVRVDGDGRVSVVRGTFPAALLAEFREVVRRDGGGPGLILIGGADGRIRFAGRIGSATQQRIRNVWFSRPERKQMRA